MVMSSPFGVKARSCETDPESPFWGQRMAVRSHSRIPFWGQRMAVRSQSRIPFWGQRMAVRSRSRIPFWGPCVAVPSRFCSSSILVHVGTSVSHPVVTTSALSLDGCVQHHTTCILRHYTSERVQPSFHGWRSLFNSFLRARAS